MKIAIAQINPTIGDVQGNVKRVLQAAREAASEGACLVVCPELCILGYPPRDLLLTPSLVDSGIAALSEIASLLPPGIFAIVGYVDRNRTGAGRPFHNAAALLGEKRVLGRYFKRLLPFYDVFEDERYFEPGSAAVVWEVLDRKIGVTICEDAWNERGFASALYHADPVAELSAAHCDFVVNLSASPFHLGKPGKRLELFRACARKAAAPMVFCNQVGAHDDLVFDGASFAVDENGQLLTAAKVFSSDIRLLDISKSAGAAEPWAGVAESEWIRGALELGVRDYVSKSGARDVIVGLSGGIDSSVVACIASMALSAERVIGVSLPTRFTSDGTRADARELARRLGIRFREIPVDGVYESHRTLLDTVAGAGTRRGLVDENLQPRIRMTVLMALSQEFGALLLNTSNKSEIACGYATLYGDTAGALAVLGDLTKRRVYELARLYNSGPHGASPNNAAPTPPIPESILTRAPSAELRFDQRDEDSLPPYALLDTWVTEAVEQGMDKAALLERHPSDAAQVERFIRLYAGSEFKRFQTPPILRVTPRAFGRGRRIPLASTKPF